MLVFFLFFLDYSEFHGIGGHTNTERGYLPTLASKLQAELAKEGESEVEMFVSEKDKHPLQLA